MFILFWARALLCNWSLAYSKGIILSGRLAIRLMIRVLSGGLHEALRSRLCHHEGCLRSLRDASQLCGSRLARLADHDHGEVKHLAALIVRVVLFLGRSQFVLRNLELFQRRTQFAFFEPGVSSRTISRGRSSSFPVGRLRERRRVHSRARSEVLILVFPSAK